LLVSIGKLKRAFSNFPGFFPTSVCRQRNHPLCISIKPIS